MKEYLPIVELFYSIQGEGANAGNAAFFIRLAGCKVHCRWCDSKNSWNEDNHPKITIPDILEKAKSHPARLVVITGGEPLTHNLDNLCLELKKANFKICLETSGTEPLSGKIDWITLSPKRDKEPLEEVCKAASELKVVIGNGDDFAFAEKYRKMCHKETRLYLQPEWNNRDLITPDIIEYIKQNPQWNLSLQIHKYIDVP